MDRGFNVCFVHVVSCRNALEAPPLRCGKDSGRYTSSPQLVYKALGSSSILN